jgi:hypothetical protein
MRLRAPELEIRREKPKVELFGFILQYSLDKTKNLFAAGNEAWAEHTGFCADKWVGRVPEHCTRTLSFRYL